MESYGDDRLDPAHNDDSGSFGVKVKVQGINGRPYVVLNAQENNVHEYPDVFLMENRQQGFLSYMSGSASSIPTPLRNHEIPRNTQFLPYHRSTVSQCGRVWFSSPPSPVNASHVMVKRVRIPLPGADREMEPEVENIPCHTSHIICRGSPRVGHRSRMRPDLKRRSRSAEARLTLMDPKTSGIEMEVESSTDVSSAIRRREVTEVRSAERSKVKDKSRGPSSREREAQVTPDLLKGRQELPDPPDEKTAKQVMLNYLKESTLGQLRSSDGDDVIRHRVDGMFEQIHMLKFRTAETLEEFELADPLKEVKDLKDRRAALESEISHLKQHVQQETTNNEEKQKRLQEALETSKQEQLALRHKLTDMEKDLQTSLDQLLQVKRSRDACRVDMRTLQQQLSDIHDELDISKSSEVAERDTLLQDLSALRSEFGALQDLHEEQGEVLHLRERELTALRGALEDEIAAHARDVDILNEMHQREVQKLLRATEEAKESLAVLGQKVLEVAAEKAANHTRIAELSRTQTELQETIGALEEQITTLNYIIQQDNIQKNLLEERVDRLTMEKQNVEEELMEVRQQEEHMCGANQAIMRHLEDTQSELSELNRAHRELKERLQEESVQMEELQKRKSELEEQRRNQNREFELLQEEMSAVVLSSERETQRLQNEVDTIRDHNQRELKALHTQLHNTHTQLQTQTAQKYHRERCVLEDKLSRCDFELNKATMRTQQLQKRIQQLEENRHTHEDKHIKLMEVKVLELEKCVIEEQNSSDLLMEKLERGREQMEQVRSDLLQERAARQDLECDKISLERQNKDLRCRVSQLEACQRTGQDTLLSKLQLHIHELEEKLLQEQKENGDLQQQNRKLERKMKETTLLQDEERLSLQDQRDQLLLRLKSLKRLLDESEEEIQRLENSKRKLQRDVDEQQEMNEQLQTQLSALRMDIRREKRPDTLQMTDDDDDDDEDERAVSSD